jgi:hypothetical protein
MKRIEIVNIESNKTPIFLELPVPELTFPYLVGNPKKGGELLSWVEKPSVRSTVLSWGLSCSLEEIEECMQNLAFNRGRSEKWETNDISVEKAKSYFSSIGVDKIQVNDNIITPKDPSLLGSVIVIKGKKYPLIHNVKRGLCFLRGE